MKRRNLQSVTVAPTDSLRRAMKLIDRTGFEVAFVADKQSRVVGTLTDGDIRRAILSGTSIDGPFVGKAMQRNFTSVGENVTRAEVLDMMRAQTISQVPVLDSGGRLVGLHLLQELIGASVKENVAVIMAGGQGIRLRPMTEHVPKPMLTVAGRPILERLVLHLVGYGIREIFLSINYLGHIIEDHFGDGSRFGCRIRYLREKKSLGTGGPLSLLPKIPNAPVLVMNGDLVTQANIDGILGFHTEGRFVATSCLKPYQIEVPFGVAEVDGNRLVSFREKPTQQLLINAGIYVLSKRALALVPKDEPFPVTEIFTRCLSKKMSVGAHVLEGEWMDVGRHDDLRKARGI